MPSSEELKEYYDHLTSQDRQWFPTSTITQEDSDWREGWE